MFVQLVGKFIQECSNRWLTGGRDRGRRRIRRKRDNNARFIDRAVRVLLGHSRIIIGITGATRDRNPRR